MEPRVILAIAFHRLGVGGIRATVLFAYYVWYLLCVYTRRLR
jgi:hypothetical protein